jgi:hypothetical protein
MNPYLQVLKQMIKDGHICIDDLKDIISKKEDAPKNLTTQEQEMEEFIERIMNR